MGAAVRERSAAGVRAESRKFPSQSKNNKRRSEHGANATDAHLCGASAGGAALRGWVPGPVRAAAPARPRGQPPGRARAPRPRSASRPSPPLSPEPAGTRSPAAPRPRAGLPPSRPSPCGRGALSRAGGAADQRRPRAALARAPPRPAPLGPLAARRSGCSAGRGARPRGHKMAAGPLRGRRRSPTGRRHGGRGRWAPGSTGGGFSPAAPL